MNLKHSTIEPVIGSEVTGIDLANDINSATAAEIQTLWDDRLVLVFRDQSLDDNALIRFSEFFGELDPPGPNPYGRPINPDNPLINIISNLKDEAGHALGNLGDGEAVWHQDMTYVEKPPRGAVLHAHELPPSGGNTYFSNMYAAYSSLDETTKALIDDKVAIHDASRNSAGMLRKGYEPVTDPRDTPGAHQPLVRTNPRTGKKCLMLGRRPGSYIPGLEVDESEALLDRLWAHASQPGFTMTHIWQLGDVLMWDNLSVLHKRDAFDPATRRRLHRTQLRGTELVE